MHLRRVKVKSGKSWRLYSQVVQSYRRKDGVSAKRVIANLGSLTDEAHENFNQALKASREQQRIVDLPALSDSQCLKPHASLEYLDLAVMLELWHSCIERVVAESLPPRAIAGTVDIVAALTLQRCIAPSSKLASIRWLPRTALPELLGIKLSSHNNTRVHRVLNIIESATPGIMSRIAPSLQQSEDFASLFIDVTDTWFEGKGPNIASRAKTKEGMTKKKVGIVMMCSDQGYPLRWEVCEGHSADCTTMTALMRKVSGLQWLSGKPVVCDRAMGHPSTIFSMEQTGIHFVTALRETEFDGFGCSLPSEEFTDIIVSSSVEVQPHDLAMVTATAARSSQLRKLGDDLFIKGLGELTWETNAPYDRDEMPTVRAMRQCQEIEQALADGHSLATSARKCGVSRGIAVRYLGLGKLCSDIQAAVRAGDGAEYGIAALLRIAKLKTPEMQLEAFIAMLASPPERDLPIRTRSKEIECISIKIKAIAYFSPRYFVESRARGQRKRAEVEASVATLNRRAHSNSKHYTKEKLFAAAENVLRKLHFLNMFECSAVRHEENSRKYWQIELRLNQKQWAQKRANDGFMVVAAHPALPHGDEELVRLYRAKNHIERGFRTIKSLIKLRPIRHRQVTKIYAHVTICMLALLLERILATRLNRTLGISAEMALELLQSCRLSVKKLKEGHVYASTVLDKDQHDILRALGMLYLADDQALADRITPRS